MSLTETQRSEVWVSPKRQLTRIGIRCELGKLKRNPDKTHLTL